MKHKFTKTEIAAKTDVIKTRIGFPAQFKYKTYLNGVYFDSDIEYGIQAIKPDSNCPEYETLDHHGTKKDFVNAVYNYLKSNTEEA